MRFTSARPSPTPLSFVVMSGSKRRRAVTGSTHAGMIAGFADRACERRVIGIDGSSAYNDVAAACAVFTTFYLVRIWMEERQDALLILAGLAAGFCYAVKYPAALAGPYALLLVSWKLRREPARCLRSAALVSACALLMAGPG